MMSEPDAWLFLWAAFIFHWLMALLSLALPQGEESNAAGHLCFCHQQVMFDCRMGPERMFCPVWVNVQVRPMQLSVSLIAWFCKMLLLVREGESQKVSKVWEWAFRHSRDPCRTPKTVDGLHQSGGLAVSVGQGIKDMEYLPVRPIPMGQQCATQLPTDTGNQRVHLVVLFFRADN